MDELRELQKEIEIRIKTYKELAQSDYCEAPISIVYLQGKIEILEVINKEINNIFYCS